MVPLKASILHHLGNDRTTTPQRAPWPYPHRTSSPNTGLILTSFALTLQIELQNSEELFAVLTYMKLKSVDHF